MAMVVEELTPNMVYERLSNSSNEQYRNAFSYDGICAIFSYFETMDDREYEFYDPFHWYSMFYEANSAEDFLKEVEPSTYQELKEKFSEFDLPSECYNYIEQNYNWAEVVGDDCHVLVQYDR